MTVTITTTPIADTALITTEQVKAWLNIPSSIHDDDDLIKTVLIPGVMDYVTRRTGVSFSKRQHEVSAESFADLDFCHPGQGHAGWVLEHYDALEAKQPVDPANYRVEVVGDRIIVTQRAAGFPAIDSTLSRPVLLTFTTKATMTDAMRLGVMGLVTIRYSNRGDDWTEKIPVSVGAIIDQATVRRIH